MIKTDATVSVRDLYKNLDQYSNQLVTVNGWIRTTRESKTFGFIELHDGTNFQPVQIVFEREKLEQGKDEKFPTGAAISVIGTVLPTPDAAQPFEIQAHSIQVLGSTPSNYPLQKNDMDLILRTQQHLRVRTNMFQAVFRVRSVCAALIHRFFQENGFIYVHTPIITGSDAEGAGEMFEVTTLDLQNIPFDDESHVDYNQDFLKKANLTVSGQLYAEAYAMAFSNVYTFGPTFRAENSNTTRHAAEFWMIEPEMAFADLEDDMAVAESMLKYVLSGLLQELPDEMAFFDKFVDKGLIERLQNIIDNDFAHVTYTEAIEYLQKADVTFEYPVSWGTDLQTEHERYLTEQVFKKPVFVTDYPKEIKAFYMRQNDDQKTVAAMDLLVPSIGEIIGGSQREERLELLTARMKELNFAEEEYAWYLQLREYGTCQHSGFGLGFERLVMYVTGMSNIRDVIPFPRTVGSADF